MATMQSSLPVWLLDGKEEITNSKAWNDFLEDLHDAVEQQLKESRVQSFSDLSVNEQNLFVENAKKTITNGPSYNDLFHSVSKSLDHQLNDEVSRQMLEEFPIDTKNDLVIKNVQDGMVSLLKKWPDMKSKFTAFFNQVLTPMVRPVAWKSFLENGKDGRKYMLALRSNSRSVVSPIDRSISKTLEQLINLEPNYEDLKGNVGAFSVMRSVLSYYHLMLRVSAEFLVDSFFHLLLPLVLSELPNIPQKERASTQLVAQLIEEYFVLISSLPRFVSELIYGLKEEQGKTFSKRVAKNLYQINPDLAASISSAFVPKDENIVATEVSSRMILDDAIRSLMKPVIRNLFVCHVNKDVMFYIWDQYMIGLDSPDFADDYLPAVAALFLLLLGDKLRAAGSPGKMEICLERDGRSLKVAQFQYAMKKHFSVDLRARLRHENNLFDPVLDPTQANFPSWSGWFDPIQLPSHMTSEERRRIRDERDAERIRQLQKRRQDFERRRKEEEEEALKRQAKKHENDRNLLEEELDKERRRRQEMERSAAEEIERLRSEIEELRHNQKRPQSRSSMASFISHYLIPPPRTPHRDLSLIEEEGEVLRINPTMEPPSPQTSPLPPGSARPPQEKLVSDAILDFIKKVSQSFHRVAGGEGYQKTDLDNASKEAIVAHRNDVMRAEVEVFGHELPPGEFERLPRDVKEEKSREMLDVIRRRIIDRRRDRLRNGARR